MVTVLDHLLSCFFLFSYKAEVYMYKSLCFLSLQVCILHAVKFVDEVVLIWALFSSLFGVGIESVLGFLRPWRAS